MSENGVFYFAIYTISSDCLFFLDSFSHSLPVSFATLLCLFRLKCFSLCVQMCNCSIAFVWRLFMCWAENLLDLMQWVDAMAMCNTLALISVAIMKYTITEFPIWQINLKLNCFAQSFFVSFFQPFFSSLCSIFLIIVMMLIRRSIRPFPMRIDIRSWASFFTKTFFLGWLTSAATVNYSNDKWQNF